MKHFVLAAFATVLLASPTLAASPETVGADVVKEFAVHTFDRLNNVTGETIDLALARELPTFVDEKAWTGYVEALKSSGNYDLIKDKPLTVSTIIGYSEASQADGSWKVTFPAEVSYRGPLNIRQCLDVTMTVVEPAKGLAVKSVIMEDGECEDNRDS